MTVLTTFLPDASGFASVHKVLQPPTFLSPEKLNISRARGDLKAGKALLRSS